MNSVVKRLIDGEYSIEVNGIRHWVKVAGAANATIPLVIIHGGPGGNNYNFERTTGPMLERFSTVIYYEQRGCGRSDAPEDSRAYSIELLVSDLDQLRRNLGLEKIIPLGYSFGGELALEYALAFPDSVKSVIVEAPSTGNWLRHYHTQMWGFEAVSEGDLKRKIREIIAEKSPLEERYNKVWQIVDVHTVDRFLFHNSETARINRQLWQESGLKNTGLMAKVIFEELEHFSLVDRISDISIPVLALVGLHDRNIGIENIRDMMQPIAKSEMVIFEQSAHFPDMEEPEKFVETVKNFIVSQV